MTAQSLVAFIMVMLAVNATPGPGMAAIVGATLSSGVRVGLAVFTGSLIGDYAYFLAAILGAGALAEAIGAWFKLFTLAAGTYLLWIGIRGFRAAARQEAGAEGSPKEITLQAGFVSGLLITLGNPNVILFFLAVLPIAVDLGKLSAPDVIAMSLLLVAASALVFAVLIGAAALTRKHLMAGGRGAIAERITGAFLAAAGAWLIYDGVASLIRTVA